MNCLCFQVVISGFYSNENNQVINLDRPIKAVAMDPDFYKPGRGKHFVTGDDKVRWSRIIVRLFCGKNESLPCSVM